MGDKQVTSRDHIQSCWGISRVPVKLGFGDQKLKGMIVYR